MQHLLDALLQRAGQPCEWPAAPQQLLPVPLVLPAAKGLVLTGAVLHEGEVIGAQEQVVIVPLGQLLQLSLDPPE